ncbi:MAG: HEAT repeat domain-containing protein [Verrucomicrobiota bacterium]
MKPGTRKRTIFALGVLTLAAGYWFFHVREPAYQGRSASEWLENIDPSGQGSRRSRMGRGRSAGYAFQAMGDGAVPFLKRHVEIPFWEKWLTPLADNSKSIGAVINRQQALRPRAIIALGLLGEPARPALPALQKAAQSADPDIAAPALASLARIDRAHLATLRDVLSQTSHPQWPVAARATVWLGADALELVPQLVRAANTSDRTIQMQAMNALNFGFARVDDTDFAPALIALTLDPAPFVRGWAAMRMGSLRGDLPGVVPCLLNVLQDRDAQVRTFAINSLKQLDQPHHLPEVLRALGKLLDDPSDPVRKAAIYAFAERGTLADIRLLTETSDRDPSMSLAISQAIGRIESRHTGISADMPGLNPSRQP